MHSNVNLYTDKVICIHFCGERRSRPPGLTASFAFKATPELYGFVLHVAKSRHCYDVGISRRRSDSNRCEIFCRDRPNRSDTAPCSRMFVTSEVTTSPEPPCPLRDRTSYFVGIRRLELLLPFGNKALNLARLPISPYAYWYFSYYRRDSNPHCRRSKRRASCLVGLR